MESIIERGDIVKSTIIYTTKNPTTNVTKCQCHGCKKEFDMCDYELDFIEYCPMCGSRIILINR